MVSYHYPMGKKTPARCLITVLPRQQGIFFFKFKQCLRKALFRHLKKIFQRHLRSVSKTPLRQLTKKFLRYLKYSCFANLINSEQTNLHRHLQICKPTFASTFANCLGRISKVNQCCIFLENLAPCK